MIGIIGATGFTGKLIANELLKRKSSFFIAGRNEQSLRILSKTLGGISYRIIDVQNNTTFSALDGCNIVINCAGPFTDYGEPVVKESIARRAHYIDTTGEQGFIKLVYDKYDELARRAGIVLVPACAFEYAIGDAAAAQLCQDFPDARSIETIYSIDGMYTSPGTRKSMVRALSAPGFLLKGGKLIQSKPGAESLRTQMDGKTIAVMSFPAGEVLMLPRHSNVQDVTTFMTADADPMILKMVGAAGQFILKATGDFFISRESMKVPSDAQRESTTFKIQARTKTYTDYQSITVTGKDPYWLTAVLVSGAVEHLQNNPPSTVGTITPAMVGGPDLVRRLLEQSGCAWRRSY